MRQLSSSLLAAQRQASAEPYVRVVVEEKIGEAIRLNYSRLYTGSEADFYHALTVPGDGSLVRARVEPAGNTLYLQRVTSPGPGSNFGSWTSYGSVSGSASIALASRGAQVLLFYVATDNVSIYVKESSDYGASFGAPVLVVSAANPAKWLASAINNGGVVALFYALSTGTVYVIKRASGTWGSPTAWSNTVAQVTGLACVYWYDWNLAVTGTDSSSNYLVWTCIYGDGVFQPSDTWSSLRELAFASSGSGVEYHAPFLDCPGEFHLFVVEKYTGTVSYSRPLRGASIPLTNLLDNRWRELVPFNLSSSYGVAIASDSSYAWLSIPAGVWRAPRAVSQVELSQDVLGVIIWCNPYSGKAEIRLRNDDGRYNSPGTGVYAPLKKGAQVRISLGYRTSAGLETSTGAYYWVSGWRHLTGGAEGSFVLQAEDAWSLLARWRARRQYTWAVGERNLFQLLAFLLAKVGMDLTTVSYSSTLVNHYPAFTLHPNEKGDAAVRRLLSMVPDRLFFGSGSGYLRYLQPSEATDYAYGVSHPIMEGEYGAFSLPVNQVQVFGSVGMAEVFNWQEVEAFQLLNQVRDMNLDTVAKMQDRGTSELDKAALEGISGAVLIPVNCGQEMYDVVEITDSRAGLSAARRRVVGMVSRYALEKGGYVYIYPPAPAGSGLGQVL